MSAEAVMRTAAVLTCATTLSLFGTIVAYAAANVAPLRWDGSLCRASQCGSAIVTTDVATLARIRNARIAAHA